MTIDNWTTDSSFTSVSIFVGAVVGVASAALYLRSSSTNNAKNSEKDRLPPLFTSGIYTFFKHLLSNDAPMQMMQIGQEMKTDVYRVEGSLPFQPMFFVTLDYKTARRVLEDPKSSKWEPTNQFFIDTTRGSNFITASGHRWKHVRKSTMECFSSANVRIMKETIKDVVDQWAKNTLDAKIDQSSSGHVKVDILEEMNQITATIIGIVAFDYEFTLEERNLFLRSLETCWVEFGQKIGLNMLKKLPLTRWMFLGIREGQAAAKVMQGVCAIMLKKYRDRQETAPQPHKLIHAIVNDSGYENDAERLRDMVAFVIAGFDTTANTLAFAFLELAMDASIQNDLRREVASSDAGTASKMLKMCRRNWSACTRQRRLAPSDIWEGTSRPVSVTITSFQRDRWC